MTAAPKMSLRSRASRRKALSRCATENAAVIPTLDVLVVIPRCKWITTVDGYSYCRRTHAYVSPDCKISEIDDCVKLALEDKEHG